MAVASDPAVPDLSITPNGSSMLGWHPARMYATDFSPMESQCDSTFERPVKEFSEHQDADQISQTEIWMWMRKDVA